MTTPERSVEEQISTDVLEVAREWMRRMDVKSGEDDREVRVVWIAEDTVRLCSVDAYGTSAGPEFVIRVKATRLPPPGPEQDGALRDELSLLPLDDLALIGPGLVTDVVRAAIAWRKQLGQVFDTGELAQAVNALNEALKPSAETWEPITWEQVKAGDRVRLPAGDGYAEADVESVADLSWVGRGTREIKVRLKGRDQPYAMPPSGRVEVLRRPALDAMSAEAFRALQQSFAQVTLIGQEES